MSFRFGRKSRWIISGLAVLAIALSVAFAYVSRPAPTAKAAAPTKPFCGTRPQLCTETTQPWNYAGQYTGHDEPSLLFYSNTPGSGNSDLYQLTLPTDPPKLPSQDGTGGTWNFQLHPAFWFGMALCDDASAPNPGGSSVGAQIPCTPNSDSNIFTGTTPGASNYMGLTPGTAFMEMQFYPPGWDSFGCTQTQWCSAMTIDSFSSNSNTGAVNNADCLNRAGEEYVNFALITKSGNSQGPADPLDQTAATFTPGPDTLMYNAGDKLTVDLHDTTAGFQIVIHDLTSGQSGSMTASIANAFGHPLYQPSATTCGDQAYAFHPMYATSSPSTRVLWAAHSYNVAYSDEIGHFEYCAAQTNGTCTSAGVSDPSGVDGDDAGCLTAPAGTAHHAVSLTGCSGTDADFDGPQYFNNWPGTNANAGQDRTLHASPVIFTSPLFNGSQNYSRVAFENDLPRIEFATSPPCQRHVSNPSDPQPGAGCVDPAAGTTFYPFFNASSTDGQCAWYEGGAFTPHNVYEGITPSIEYGGLQDQLYPRTGPGVQGIYETFHRTLPNNPCPA
jgi:hypothetical protein